MTLLFILYIIYQYLSIKVILFKYVIDNKRKCLKLVKIRQEREPLKKGAPLLYIKSVAYTYDREPLYAGAQVFNGEVCSLYVCESVEQ